MEIEKVVQDKFAEIVGSGFIEEQVKKQLQETIKGAVEQSLRSYSDFGKSIEKALKESITGGKFDFPDYNQLVSNWVMDIVNNTLISEGKAQITKNLEEFFKPLEKSEWLLSEIVSKYIEHIRENEDEESGELTIIVDKDKHHLTKEYWDVYLDSKPNKSKYNCNIALRINETGVWNVTLGSKSMDKDKFPLHYNFESFLFQLFSTKAKIINDERNCQTEWDGGYDD